MSDTDTIVRMLSRTRLWSHSMSLLGSLTARVAGTPKLPVSIGNTKLALDDFVKSAPETFMAGAASVDITPANAHGLALAGFDYDRRCSGVMDPLFARALVLWDGHNPLVIVTLDLIGLSLPRTKYIRSLLTRDLSDSVLVLCTHNHQAPDTLGMWGKSLGGVLPIQTGIDSEYMEQVQDGIITAVTRALAGAHPASIHFASGVFDTTKSWITNERSGTLDQQMRVLYVKQARGDNTIATVVQHACHPETLWKNNTLVSGDFCSRCCFQVERALGGVALYANGSLGSMVTGKVVHESSLEERIEFANRLGAQMARSAIRLVSKAAKTKTEDQTIKVATRTIVLPRDGNPFFELLVALGVVELRELSDGFVTQMSLARLGPALMLGLPGEPSPELGIELLARLAVDTRFIFGLANDELGYLMPPEFFWNPVYAYERTMSPGPMSAFGVSLGLEYLLNEIYND